MKQSENQQRINYSRLKPGELLVLSEEGELALVATPNQFTEMAKMAAFRLGLEGR